MKKLLFIAGSVFLLSSCATIKREVYKREIEVTTEYLDGKLDEDGKELVDSGVMTQEEWEDVRKGAEWMLVKIRERAEQKKAEAEEE